jgi:GT2 family glycosyltransferase
MVGNPQLGIVSPIHLNGKGKAIDLYFSKYLGESDTKGFLTNIILKSVPFRPYIKTNFVNAAAWLISRECIIKTGGFDPIFFHYGEDRNYSQRVLFWGFEIGIVTRAFIFHDREERILRNQYKKQPDKEKEWEHFLTNACDIQRMDATMFMAKRWLRHGLQSFKHLATFDIHKLSLDLFMLKKIAISAPRIYSARRRCRVRDSGAALTNMASLP